MAKQAKTKAKTKDLSLESVLWNCRNALRGTIGGSVEATHGI